MHSSIVNQIPKEPRTLIGRYHLDPNMQTFLSCPACYSLYPYTSGEMYQSSRNQHCTFTFDGSLCGTPLWINHPLRDSNIWCPARKYIHHHLMEWLGRLLSRPGIEELLEEVCHREPHYPWQDISDSPAWQNFCDSDMSKFMVANANRELRLMFSLGMDSFNPFHSKQAKQSASSTGLYFNVYLAGVLPGPGKPSLEESNHSLRLIVDDFEALWKGVTFTKTFAFPSGRSARGVLVPIICDMLGARQAAGFTGATSTFPCTVCDITNNDIGNFSPGSWQPRDFTRHLRAAMTWSQQTTIKARESLTEKYGVRWTELLHLPYWDPIQYTVIDSMHLVQNLVSIHCREIWGINVDIEGTEGRPLPLHARGAIPERPSSATMLHWQRLLTSANDESLRTALAHNDDVTPRPSPTPTPAILSANKDSLFFACYTPTPSRASTEELEADNVDIRRCPRALCLDRQGPDKPQRHVLGKSVMENVYADMRSTILPSYVKAAPADWGTAGRGKLSAAEWKTIGTIHLPITLIHLWGTTAEGSQKRKMLEHFIHLTKAILILDLRFSSNELSILYEEHIQSYLVDLAELYPDIVIKITHHVAQHAGEFLRRFGPVHSYRTQVFERTNGIMQDKNTNSKFGDIESTFLFSTTREANLRALV
ncbi:hypothetical protein ARMGADRAFT_941220, partial [Armillaria gallica]